MPNPTLPPRLRRILSPRPFAYLRSPASNGCATLSAKRPGSGRRQPNSAFTVSAQPSVVIDTFNGSITVAASSDNQIETTVTKTGSGANQEAAEGRSGERELGLQPGRRHGSHRRPVHWPQVVRVVGRGGATQGPGASRPCLDDIERGDHLGRDPGPDHRPAPPMAKLTFGQPGENSTSRPATGPS